MRTFELIKTTPEIQKPFWLDTLKEIYGEENVTWNEKMNVLWIKHSDGREDCTVLTTHYENETILTVPTQPLPTPPPRTADNDH